MYLKVQLTLLSFLGSVSPITFCYADFEPKFDKIAISKCIPSDPVIYIGTGPAFKLLKGDMNFLLIQVTVYSGA